MAEKTAEEIAAEALAEAEKVKQKTKFDESQTIKVNALYNEAFKAGAEKAEAEAAKKLADEKAALEAKIAELTAKIPAEKEEKKETAIPELDLFKNQMLEMKTILEGIKTERDTLKSKVETAERERRKTVKKDLFLDATTKAKVNFFDPLEAYKLAEDDGYEYDEENERPVIKNKSTGAPKLNENGEVMSVIDYVKDFAKRKNYLVQAAGAGGTGSGEQRIIEQKKEETVDFSKMTPAQFEAYRQEVLTKTR